MDEPSQPTGTYPHIRAELSAAEAASPMQALPHLRAALEALTALLDEVMAEAVLTEEASIRAVGARAGLSENAVGPRLARTQRLGAYANAEGRVTAAAIERAQYDLESGTPREPTQPTPKLRFKPRST
jgi:hypothetical protein